MACRKAFVSQYASGLEETAQASESDDKTQGHTLVQSGQYTGKGLDAGGDLHDPQKDGPG